MSAQGNKVTKIVTAQDIAVLMGKKHRYVLDMTVATDPVKAALSEYLAASETQGKTQENWMDKAPETFTMLCVTEVENAPEKLRLVAIPSFDAVKSDDGVMRRLYRSFVTRVANFAGREDVEEADFITVGGTYRNDFDTSAFTAFAKPIADALKAQGAKDASVKSLRSSMENSATAKALFPRLPDASWLVIFDIFIKAATKANKSTAIFTHWLATRDAKIDKEGGEIDMTGFADIAAKKIADKAAEPKDDEPAEHPAETTAETAATAGNAGVQ